MANSTAQIYTQDGKVTGKVTLPEQVFGVSWNGDLVHQVVTSLESNVRSGIAHVKDRSEVRGGGAKPWRQKGTGRARHGSTRSPIWTGGGVTFGPRKNKDYTKKVNKKAKTKALFTVLSKKLEDGEILFVEKMRLPEIKTKSAQAVLEGLAKVDGFGGILSGDSVLVGMLEHDDKAVKSFRNIPGITVKSLSAINVLDVLKHKILVVTEPKESVLMLEQKGTSSTVTPSEASEPVTA